MLAALQDVETWTIAEVVAGIEGSSCLLLGTAIMLGQYGPVDMVPPSALNFSISGFLGFSMWSTLGRW